jgi:hypothetical protein
MFLELESFAERIPKSRSFLGQMGDMSEVFRALVIVSRQN